MQWAFEKLGAVLRSPITWFALAAIFEPLSKVVPAPIGAYLGALAQGASGIGMLRLDPARFLHRAGAPPPPTLP